jgi:hypothetical protein
MTSNIFCVYLAENCYNCLLFCMVNISICHEKYMNPLTQSEQNARFLSAKFGGIEGKASYVGR